MYQTVFQLFQARSFSLMFIVINIIVIIGKFHARAWPWLHAYTIYLVLFSNPSGDRYSVMQDRSLRSGFTLFWSVILVSSIRPRFPYCRQQSSPTIIRWGSSGNVNDNWFKWVMSSDKKTLAWNRTCCCKLEPFF